MFKKIDKNFVAFLFFCKCNLQIKILFKPIWKSFQILFRLYLSSNNSIRKQNSPVAHKHVALMLYFELIRLHPNAFTMLKLK